MKKIDEVYVVGDSRVSLDSLGYSVPRGNAGREHGGSYPTLTLEQVHGALAFYLANRDEVASWMELAGSAGARGQSAN